jgi:hypothetical protein
VEFDRTSKKTIWQSKELKFVRLHTFTYHQEGLIRSFSKQHGSLHRFFSSLPPVKLIRVWQSISTHRHVITSVPHPGAE